MSAALCHAEIVRFGCYNFRLRCIGLGSSAFARAAFASLLRKRSCSSVVLYYYTIFGCIWQNEPTKILRNQEIPKHRRASASG